MWVDAVLNMIKLIASMVSDLFVWNLSIEPVKTYYWCESYCTLYRESEAYSVPKREKHTGDVTEKHYRPKFKEVPTDVFVKEGKLTRFDCRVTGRPPPDLTWYRNGQQVYNDTNHKVLVDFINFQISYSIWVLFRVILGHALTESVVMSGNLNSSKNDIDKLLCWLWETL